VSTPSIRVTGLSPDLFRPLLAMSNVDLHQRGARRDVADVARMPCRVSVANAEIVEALLLLNYAHQSANTPYRSTHAIYVRNVAQQANDAVEAVPDTLASRLLAIRAFDATHMMFDAEVCESFEAAGGAPTMLKKPD
jgi:hypothetical protein